MDWTPEKIKDLRARLGMTQGEFAEAMGYGSNTRVSELENGRREPSGPASRLLDHLDARGALPTDSGTTDMEAGIEIGGVVIPQRLWRFCRATELVPRESEADPVQTGRHDDPP